MRMETRPYATAPKGARLWRVFVLAVASRLLFTFLIFPLITANSNLLNTVADDYDKIAHNLVLGHGYVLAPGTAPTMQRLPLYPLFLAFFFGAFGLSLWPIQLAQAAIDGVSCVLVYKIAERIYRDHAVSQLAALMFALYPGALVAAARVVTEPLYTCLLLLAVMFYFIGQQTRNLVYATLTGLVLGLMALCKSTGLLLPVCLWAVTRGARERWGLVGLRTTAILFLGMTAVLSPWIVRNYLLIGRFVPTSTIGGTVAYDGFYMASHPGSGREFSELVHLCKQEQYRILSAEGIQTHFKRYPFWFFSSEDEYRWDRLMYRAVMEGFWEAPHTLLRFLMNNVVGFWFVGRVWTTTLLNFVLHLPLLIAGASGMRRSWREGRDGAWILLAIIVYFNLFYALTLGMARYAVPVMPFVMILAAKALMDLRFRTGAAKGMTHEEASR